MEDGYLDRGRLSNVIGVDFKPRHGQVEGLQPGPYPRQVRPWVPRHDGGAPPVRDVPVVPVQLRGALHQERVHYQLVVLGLLGERAPRRALAAAPRLHATVHPAISH